MPEQEIDVLKMFREVFEIREELPEMTLENLSEFNKMRFNEKRNYYLEHMNDNKKGGKN